ncbi:MAG: bifunctional riboflavin kinase/FAD synthetase, partial [Verrucomicrobia bacterium]|nr:bifunctional riboflavin kinase/FAD synthetase [Verrucomicrobiota bacterium]
MRTVTDIQWLRGESVPLCLAMGFFDGFHRGHLDVLNSAKRRARELGGTAWLFTFDPHPSLVLRPAEAPKLLMSNAQKVDFASFAGLDGCVSMPFDLSVASQSPQDFVGHLTQAMPSLRHIAVGAQWRFGHRRSGDVQMLTDLGQANGFSVEGVNAVL